ncbi:MAG: hypothetical protein HC853_00375 [Anaerolineae bacterium]|nr:hypothetical protein [Anaerolineae bacterium]
MSRIPIVSFPWTRWPALRRSKVVDRVDRCHPQTGCAASAAHTAPGLAVRRPQPRQLDIVFSASWNKKTRQVSTHIRLQLAAVLPPTPETPSGGDASPLLPPLIQSFSFVSPAESTSHAKFMALEQALREASTWLDGLHIRSQCLVVKITTHNRITYVPRRRGQTGALRISEAKTWIERCSAR